MGIKVIKLFFYINIFLFSIMSSAQKVDTKVKFVKKYAYCNCIYLNNVKFDEKYLNDKFQTSDKSIKEFIELGKITEMMERKLEVLQKK